MHFRLPLIIPLILQVLVLFSYQLVEAFPAEQPVGRQNNLGSKPISNGYPQKKPKQEEDAEDEEDVEPATGTGGAATATAGVNAAGATNYLTTTYGNVGTILSGIFDGQIGTILQGGTAFIPPGELRNSVNLILDKALLPGVKGAIDTIGPIIQKSLNDNETSTTVIPGAVNSLRGASEISTTTQSSFFNPIKLIQDRLQGGGGGDPFKAIQERLQGLFGGGSSVTEKENTGQLGGGNPYHTINTEQINKANANRFRTRNVPSSAPLRIEIVLPKDI